jgi:hypothetical protein
MRRPSAPIRPISCGRWRVSVPSPDNLVAGGGDRQEFSRETLSGVTGLAVGVEAAGGAQQPNPSTIQVVPDLTA